MLRSYSPQLAASCISTNKQGIYPPHVTQVVPGFDGALGLHYSYSLNKGSVLSIEIGYEYATYFNAIVAYNPITVVGEVDIGTIALDSLGKTTSNFSVNGPYLNLSLAF